jgi:hypothetical protein
VYERAPSVKSGL